MYHAPVALAGQLILNVLDDGSEFGVSQPLGMGGRAVIVGAAWQVNSFVLPPDGAGAGPLMTPGLSWPFAASICGVLLARSSSNISWPTLRSRAVMRASYSNMTLA